MLTDADADRLLGRCDAVELASILRQGAVNASEVLDAAIERIERVNGTLNAVTLCFYDQARQRLAQDPPTGPFAGVPLLLKDAQTALAGYPMTQGSAMLEENVAHHDSLLGAALSRAGFSILGRTNTPEFGSMFESAPPRYGATRNPWDTTRSSGGSSGGSGAAVAARMVQVAHAGDGAGSIRVPAAHCGVFGLKPSRGRISMGPDLAESAGGITTSGFISVSVRDTAWLLDLTGTPGAGDPYVAQPPSSSFAEQAARPPRRLRIALTRLPLSEEAVDPEVLRATDDAAALCTTLGHEMIEDELPLDRGACLEAVWRHWAVSSSSSVHRLDERTGRPGHIYQASRFMQLLWRKGRGMPALDYIANLTSLQSMSRRVAEWMDRNRYDMWLSPVATRQPTPLGWLDAEVEDPEVVWGRQRDCFAFTPLLNHMGWPAMSVPLHWSPGGLPIGTQFCARLGEEGLLLSLATQLEDARPWRGRLPPLNANA